MFNINEIILKQSSTFDELIKQVDKTGSGIALIVDENNKFRSLMTDGDIRRAILAGTNLQTRVGDIGNTVVTTVMDGTPEANIMQLMDRRIRHIPILNVQGEVVDLAVSPNTAHGDSAYGMVSYLTKNSPMESRVIQKVLLIGGAGYIGSIIARKLLTNGYKVKILDQFIYGGESLLEIQEHPDLEIVRGDTKNIGDVVQVMHDIDAVIHLAELVGDPACSYEPVLAQVTNLFATENIARICKHLKIAKMVYASSCSVYGASSDPYEQLTEESPLNPVSLYASMKIEAEKALFGLRGGCFQPTILRLGTVFGPSPRMRFDLVINLLCAKALMEKKITIFGGEQWRPFVHVEDVADAFFLALESPIDIVGGQVFNVGGNEMNFQIKEIGTTIKKLFPNTVVDIEGNDQDRRDYRIDFTKIQTVLGFKPKKNVIDGIRGIEQLFSSGAIKDYTDMRYSNIKTMRTNSNKK